MITQTSLKHPSLRKRLMAAHKKALKGRHLCARFQQIDTRKGVITVHWMPVHKQFMVWWHTPGNRDAVDITALVGNTL